MWASAASTVTFDDQSGGPALVKLVGPSSTTVEVKEGKQETVEATGRHYFIKVRYGTPGHYCYSKGDDLDIKETATSVSMITITLRKVVDGNYGTRQITGEEFGDSEPAQKNPAASPLQRSGTVEQRVVEHLLCKLILEHYSLNNFQGQYFEELTWQLGVPLNQRLARAFATSRNYGRFIRDADFKGQLSFAITFERRSTKVRLEMPDHLKDTINAEVRALRILYPDKKSHEARNEREMILNQSVTPDVAANIAFVERLIEEIATKDFRDTREKLRDAIRGALKNNVSAKNAFTEAEQLAERATTDELRKSRAEVSRLIAEAKQKSETAR